MFHAFVSCTYALIFLATSGGEHCIEMSYNEIGKWNDLNCAWMRKFACEFPGYGG
jgi:hypothetical protein